MSSESNSEQVVSSRARYLLQVERHLGVPLRVALLAFAFLTWETRLPLWLNAVLGIVSVVVSVPAFWRRLWSGRRLQQAAWLAFLVDLTLAAVGGAGPQASPVVIVLLVGLAGVRALVFAPITLLPLMLVIVGGTSLSVFSLGQGALAPLERAAAVATLASIALVAHLYRDAVLERLALGRELTLVRTRSAQAEVALRRTADQLARELLALRAIQRSTRDAGPPEVLEKLLT
ncbi:MAG: hypothetical protein Q9O62_05740 [Ardenticatenia bacterium]|nr:hypothetical protein [Ardenticatenia bacterium]